MQYQLLSLALASLSAAFDIPEGSDFGAFSDSIAKRQNTFGNDPGACVTGVHIIAAGGANYTDPYAYGLLGTLPDAIIAKIPNSNKVSLPYDKLKDPAHPANLSSTAIPNGILTFNQYVSSYHSKCPDTKIVTLGYSSGAVITMSGLCQGGVPQSLASDTIIANVVYGDQTRSLGAPFNKGTCVANDGRTPRDWQQCGNYIGVTQSFCDVNDPQCCGGPAQDYMIHFVYPREYNNVAASYVASQWQKLGNGDDSTSSSSSASGSATSASASATGTAAGGLGGLSGSASSSASSAESSAASSAASSASASASSASASATSAASSAASSAAGGASSVAASATSGAAAAASSASGTLAPYNPDNGSGMMLPSFGLGAVAVFVAVFL